MKLSTPDLCDAYPDLVRIVAPIFSSFGGRAAFGGPITTIKCFEDNSRVKEQVGLAGHGRVLVVDGGGSRQCALLGDLLAAQAAKNGWAGVIIHGCIRDVDEIRQMDLGVKALGAIPNKSKRQGKGELNVSIVFGNVTFHPGEFIYADHNGLIVSSQQLILPE